MTAVLKIRGVPYSSIDEVDAAVRALAADLSLLPDEDEQREPMVMHIGELLAALPDERAQGLLSLITGREASEPSGEGAPTPSAAEPGEGADSADAAEHVPPVCPMCLGEGVLAVEPPQDPTSERCPACNGYGNVYTGSRVVGHNTRSCPTCIGNGYIAKQPDVPLPPPPVSAAPAPQWPGAQWNPTTRMWDAPEGAPPWDDARWNAYEGKYE